MIRHVVMIKLLEEADDASKEENAVLIKKVLMELPYSIAEIKYYDVGVNIIQSDRAYDLVIISEFDNLTDLDSYIRHPEHQKAVEFIATRKADTKSVDYEV
jgi:hypothetical protein